MCTFLLWNGASWDICLMHCGICEVDLLALPQSGSMMQSFDGFLVCVCVCEWVWTPVNHYITIMSWRKRQHLKSPWSLAVSSTSRSHSGCLLHRGILLTPIPFVPWQSGLPFPRYNLTLKIQGQRQRSKVPQSAQRPVDSLSYWLPSLSFHDNRASHSRDTIWP